MNWIQLGMFVAYVVCAGVAGAAVHSFLRGKAQSPNRILALGEIFLLGSILIIGEMLLLSLVKLYKAPFLWSAVGLNLGFLFLPNVRRECAQFFSCKISWNVPLTAFLLLVGFFLFRNCYFLVDVDSHAAYLYTQKLWLEHGTSIFASPAMDMRVFVPQFNAVPYALGISVFPQQTLFPQLTVAFWTVIAALLVFGYVKWRWNDLYALAAVMLTLFNDHMFYSGANNCCIINSALVALLFAVAYNFWEAREKPSSFRFVLALVFLTQVLANKYQMAYTLIMLFAAGCFIQKDLKSSVQNIFKVRLSWVVLAGAVTIGALWPLKNLLATGCPSFPMFAGQMGVLNWTPVKAEILHKFYFGPLSWQMIAKYFSFMFFWPGIHAAKIVSWSLLLLPLAVVAGIASRRDWDKEKFSQVCWWLLIAQITVIGLCLVSFLDPRHYRYGIAITAVAAVAAVDFFLHQSLRVPTKWGKWIVLLIAVQGWSIMLHQGGDFKRPFFRDNIAVLQNKLHMEHIAAYYFPETAIAYREMKMNAAKVMTGAWDTELGGISGLSAFLLPTRPQVGLWFTTAVKWDSYRDPNLVAMDLRAAGIQWVISVKDGHLFFEDPQEYGNRAVKYDFLPKRLYFNYEFPEELVDVRYSRSTVLKAFGINEPPKRK